MTYLGDKGHIKMPYSDLMRSNPRLFSCNDGNNPSIKRRERTFVSSNIDHWFIFVFISVLTYSIIPTTVCSIFFTMTETVCQSCFLCNQFYKKTVTQNRLKAKVVRKYELRTTKVNGLRFLWELMNCKKFIEITEFS